jgi:hypothetical protein
MGLLVNGYDAPPVNSVTAAGRKIDTSASRRATEGNELYTGADGELHWVQPPRAELGDRSALTTEQKRQLYRDGYIIIKGAISKELTSNAKAAIKQAAAAGKKARATARSGGQPAQAIDLNRSEEMLNLVRESRMTPILHDLMGFFDPPKACQVGVLPPREAGDNYTPVGYRDKDVPYYGANTHMDGICTIFSGIPQNREEVAGLSHDEKYRHYVNAGSDPRTGGKNPLNAGKTDMPCDGQPEPGRSCEVVGENGGVPLFNDPDCTLGIGSFTAFVFACLNDQMKEGCGQTALLRGAHHSAERYYQMQSDSGGIVGIEGEGWSRINSRADNGLGLNYLPAPIYDEFCDEERFGPLERVSQSSTSLLDVAGKGDTIVHVVYLFCFQAPDGRVWPRPIQCLMEEGDACITCFHMPHTGTRNAHGTESRKNIIFRIRAKSHNPHVVATGVSDHLDRGQWGEWLDPNTEPDDFLNPIDTDAIGEWMDPFERSKHFLCHRETVQELANGFNFIDAITVVYCR